MGPGEAASIINKLIFCKIKNVDYIFCWQQSDKREREDSAIIAFPKKQVGITECSSDGFMNERGHYA